MPIYEYACADCGHDFELMQKISDSAPSTCPKCGGKKMERLISTGAFHLKGGGWHSDGYSKDNKKSDSCDAPAKSPACSGCPSA